MTDQLVRVVAPNFVAGMIVVDGTCKRAAPILGWAVGKSSNELRAYFAAKRWRATIVGSGR